jgi:CBS domain containing-hemolysin-like protein
MSLLASSLLLLLCLLGAAFAAGVETGVIALNRLRLQHQLRRRVPGARTIRWFLAHPDVLLATTLIATNLCYVGAAVLAASIGLRLGGPAGSAAAGALLTLVILVCCEYLPKSWFQASPSTRVLPVAPLLRVLAVVLSPLIVPVNALMRFLTRQPASDPDAARLLVSREELLTIAREGVQSGVLTPHETDMIHGVFALTHKTCASLMVPRDRMVAVSATATVAEFLDLARSHAFSRYPIHDPATNTWTGVVHILDVLADPSNDPANGTDDPKIERIAQDFSSSPRRESEGDVGHRRDFPTAESAKKTSKAEGFRDRGSKTVADYARPPQLVAGYTPADHLLPRMRVTRSPLFLVTDTRYEVVGLITLEDVLQEITGED